MRRFTLALLLGFLFAAPAAFADTLYTFTLTGDGNTFQFTVPNPPAVVDHPHAVQVGFAGVTGTVDGTPGYLFSAEIVALPFPTIPEFEFTVSPDPPGITPPYTPRGDNFSLYSPILTTLVSDVPNPYSRLLTLRLQRHSYVRLRAGAVHPLRVRSG